MNVSNGSQRRYLRKVEAQKHNTSYVRTSLDSNKFEWDRHCKKCYGTGILGKKLENNISVPLLCKCVEVKETHCTK